MTDLIARLMSATGPDVELDVAINPSKSGLDAVIELIQSGNSAPVKIPAYTGSFEDALKTVPEGWRFNFLVRRESGMWEAAVETIDGKCEQLRMGATAPLAICIAAMKARGV